MSYKDIKLFRKHRKQLMLDGFGSKCQICGYNKCNEALEFHHINPNEKEMALSNNLILKWEDVLNELKKCICVCANCHREIHQGLIKIDESKQYFDETKVDGYDPSHKVQKYYDKCPICGKEKEITKKYCSKSCSVKAHQKVDWSKYDLITMIEKENRSIHSIARELDITWQAVKKRYKKLKQ